MVISAIDIGSNSVRLATFADGKTLYKVLTTTRLGEGLSFSGKLSPVAIERSAKAVSDYVQKAITDGAQKIYAFATAAVRGAQNGKKFLTRVKSLCGIDVEVLSGETEAKIAILGAVGNRDGGIIDLGGASTEVTVQQGGKTLYAKSVDIGAVRLYDLAGRDKQKLISVILPKLEEYGNFTAENFEMCGVSGTATTLAALKLGLRVYDPEKIQGSTLTLSEVENLADLLLATPIEKICDMLTVDSRRADIIAGGATLLAMLMKKLKIDKITVSDSDNLEGYVILKEGKL